MRFPAPTEMIASYLSELREAATSTDEPDIERRRIAGLPRPWDPASCPSHARPQIYFWLDHVVAWLNEQHTWRTECLIPICWDRHPHLVHEIAVVACMRWEATFARTPADLDTWQRFILPEFQHRMVERIGPAGCPPGRHQPAPGTPRQAIYRSPDEATQRDVRRGLDRDDAGPIPPVYVPPT
jgi:hypothetical protein